MSGFSGYSLADEILNFVYRGIPISISGSLYLRLLVEPSSRSGGGTETTYGSYARKQLPRDLTLFTVAPSSGRLANGVVIEMDALPTTAGNGPLTSFDIVDTPSGAFSKIYSGGPIIPAKAVVVGKAIKFRIGALVLTF
jgi:hypothetical protein